MSMMVLQIISRNFKKLKNEVNTKIVKNKNFSQSQSI